MIDTLVILDRDGVINVDSDAYVKSAEEWIPLPGSIEAIARMNQAGVRVCIATNQSGLGRGLFSIRRFVDCQQKLDRLLNSLGGQIDGVFYCPHHPDEGCDCRKPKPGMIQQALSRFQSEPKESYFVGDSFRDIQAALAAEITPILVLTGNGKNTAADQRFISLSPQPQQFTNLSDFVDSLLN